MKANDVLSSVIDKFQRAARTNKLVFLLVGRTGVGKSSTVNSLMGKPIALVGDYEATTMEVEYYESNFNGIEFMVVDTPGLCDDIESEGNDEKYLARMRSKVPQVDSMWFVSRLDDTRVTADEKRGIKLISEAFTPEIWKHAVIVFTYANSVGEARYQEALSKRTELIKKEIAKYATTKLANDIPSLAVDNTSKATPDGEEWLGELYTKVFVRISARGIIPFLMATAERITPQRFENNTDKQTSDSAKAPNWKFHEEPARISTTAVQKEIIKSRIIDAGIIPSLVAAGAGIGAVFGPAGAAIGGAIGAVVGLIGWLWD